ncbi:MAG TPA: toll/interleukin-1 receptor domain-containing protein [Longimicrobium sp.]|nr:toll/interleukin-1 receptor domain-containing protein [Longimicrobium sp.]
MTPDPPAVFVSYSHADAKWLKLLRVHLKPLERYGAISVWADTRIEPGSPWRDEIRAALERAKAAVLLITPDFLASDFIATDELPVLLRAAEERGTVILPLIVKPSRFELTEKLSRFQAVNLPSKPLAELTPVRRDAVLVQLSRIIEEALLAPRAAGRDSAGPPEARLWIDVGLEVPPDLGDWSDERLFGYIASVLLPEALERASRDYENVDVSDVRGAIGGRTEEKLRHVAARYGFLDRWNRYRHRQGKETHLPYPVRLSSLGIAGTGELADAGIRSVLASALIVDDVVLDAPVLAYEGVRPSQLRTSVSDGWAYPAEVEQARATLRAPEPNRPKVVLAGWRPPLSDEGEVLGLAVARSDFWSCLAVEKAAPSIHDRVRRGTLSLRALPRQLVCHGTVITADERILLSRRTTYVHYYKKHWSASFEESVDWAADAGKDGVPDPTNTLHRALAHEELGLPEAVAAGAEVAYVAIGTEWYFLSAPIFSVIRLPDVEAETLLDCCRNARDQEHDAWDTMPFTPEALAPLLRTSWHVPAGVAAHAGPLHGTSRFRILVALFHSLGVEETLLRLEAAPR